jgi:hypothetical protein
MIVRLGQYAYLRKQFAVLAVVAAAAHECVAVSRYMLQVLTLPA